MHGTRVVNIPSASSRILKFFLLFFVPLVLILAGVSLSYYRSVENANIQKLQGQAKLRVQFQTDTFSHEFQSIISDLIVLSGHNKLRQITDGTTSDYTSLAKEFLIFCANKKIYDQVRFLDITGMEVIRVNYNQGHPAIVPTNQLQSKGGRYYFEDTFNLEQGEVFVSPLDLNIEGGAIEQPLKPMIRFGLPIFNSRGEKRGIVLLNYFGATLIDQIAKVDHESTDVGFGMLLNREGYFFKGMSKEDEWGFMLPGRKDKTFSNIFPAQWKKIVRDASGQFLDELGLFTFTTVFPLTEGLKSSSGSSAAFGSSTLRLDSKQYRWKIVSFTPRQAIRDMTSQLRNTLLTANILFGLLAGIGLWLLAGAMVKRQRAEDEIEHMAHFDLLTGLPNRPLLYDRMGIALSNAQRNKQVLAVFFLDLDGFKDVNDTLGHEAGDEVLIEVAHRLKQCVRGSDTVARLGGDEFVLVLSSTLNPAGSVAIATKIISALSEPIMFNDHPCTVGASIGIATYPKDGETQDALLSKADAAMYVAKEAGKNTYCFSS